MKAGEKVVARAGVRSGMTVPSAKFTACALRRGWRHDAATVAWHAEIRRRLIADGTITAEDALTRAPVLGTGLRLERNQ